MKILVSPVSLEEARVVADLGTDIIDIKNPAEGSLGAQPPWVIQEIAECMNLRGVQVSATLGDLPFKPGTAALAAFGMAHLPVDYIKAGLHGTRNADEARAMLDALMAAVRLVRPNVSVVAAGYADYRRFDGLSPSDLLRAATATRCPVVMLDTAIKDGNSLFDAMSYDEIESFVQAARRENLQVALAGSLGLPHLPELHMLSPDILGVRGAMCMGRNRLNSIDATTGQVFLKAVRASSREVKRTHNRSAYSRSSSLGGR